MLSALLVAQTYLYRASVFLPQTDLVLGVSCRLQVGLNMIKAY